MRLNGTHGIRFKLHRAVSERQAFREAFGTEELAARRASSAPACWPDGFVFTLNAAIAGIACWPGAEMLYLQPVQEAVLIAQGGPIFNATKLPGALRRLAPFT